MPPNAPFNPVEDRPTADAQSGARSPLLMLPIDLIDEDRANPRREFDHDSLEALAATIRERGLLQPIAVRPSGVGGRYVLRFGARRLRAAKLAGLSEVRALLEPRPTSEADVLLEQMIENEQREGLNTAELAEAVQRLLAAGMSQAEIGRRIGRTKDQIAMLASVQAMAAPLRALASNLGLRTLYELAGAWKADPDRAAAWISQRSEEGITQAEARTLARTLAKGEAEAIPLHAGDDGGSSVALAPKARRTRTPQQVTLVFEVSVRGRSGRLLLDKVAAPISRATVELEDGTQFKAPLDQIKLVRIRPA